MMVRLRAGVGLLGFALLVACGTSYASPPAASTVPRASQAVRPPVPATRSQLVGRWEVTEVNRDAHGGDMPVLREPVHRDAFLELSADGAVMGSDGTNAVSGRFVLSRAGLSIGDAAIGGLGLDTIAPKVRRDLQSAFAGLLAGKPVVALMSRGRLVLLAGDWDLELAPAAGPSA